MLAKHVIDGNFRSVKQICCHISPLLPVVVSPKNKNQINENNKGHTSIDEVRTREGSRPSDLTNKFNRWT